MLKFLQTPKGLIITAVIILVLVIVVSYNWGKIKGIFSSTPLGTSGRNIKCPPCNPKAPGFDIYGYGNPRCCGGGA